MFKTIYSFSMTGEQFEDWNDCKEIYYSKMPAYMDECKLMIDEFTEEDED